MSCFDIQTQTDDVPDDDKQPIDASTYKQVFGRIFDLEEKLAAAHCEIVRGKDRLENALLPQPALVASVAVQTSGDDRDMESIVAAATASLRTELATATQRQSALQHHIHDVETQLQEALVEKGEMEDRLLHLCKPRQSVEKAAPAAAAAVNAVPVSALESFDARLRNIEDFMRNCSLQVSPDRTHSPPSADQSVHVVQNPSSSIRSCGVMHQQSSVQCSVGHSSSSAGPQCATTSKRKQSQGTSAAAKQKQQKPQLTRVDSPTASPVHRHAVKAVAALPRSLPSAQHVSCSAGPAGTASGQTLPPRARFGKLCAYHWRNGRCKKGTSCDFLHADTQVDRWRTNKVRSDMEQASSRALAPKTFGSSSTTQSPILSGGRAAHQALQPDQFGFTAVTARRPNRWNRNSTAGRRVATDSAGTAGTVGGRFAPLAEEMSQ